MNEKTSVNLNEKLRNDPLLAAVFLLNPKVQMRLSGVELSESEEKLFAALSVEDEKQAENLLLSNLRLGSPQIAQPAPDEERLLSPKISAEAFNRDSDIVTKISTELIKYQLENISRQKFTNRKFDRIISGDWWQLQAAGENIEVEISASGIRLLVDLRCRLSMEIELDSGKLQANQIKFPLNIEILPAFVVSSTQLYLSIARGQINLLNFPLPQRAAVELASALGEIFPHIPVCAFPSPLNLTGSEPEPAILLTAAQVDESGISLGFHLNDEFETAVDTVQIDKRKILKTASFLSDKWSGGEGLWNYPKAAPETEVEGCSSGQAVMATISDFMGRNPFSLTPNAVPSSDGKKHYEHSEQVGNFYSWYPPRETLGQTQVSGREDLVRAFKNLKFDLKEFHLDTAFSALEAQRALIDWVVNERLPSIVLLDIGKLTILENLSTGENETRSINLAAHWGIVYAVNNAGVKMASWGNEYFIPWDIFMNAWHCDFLPYPNNYYQIHVWDPK